METVENLKVVISLRYQELDFTNAVILKGNEKLAENAKLVTLGIKEGDKLKLQQKPKSICTLI